MFEIAELGNKLSKEEFDAQEPELRVGLLNAQFDLQHADFNVLILVAGEDRLACNDVVNLMHAWMDARHIDTHAFELPSEEERERPLFWRYWRAFPRRGRIGLFVGAWVNNAIAQRKRGELDEAGFDQRIAHVRQLEESLIDDGTLVLKFWLHLPKEEYARRLRKAKKKPDKAWRLSEADWQGYEDYDAMAPIVAHFVEATDTGAAPWTVVESTDERYRDLTIMQAIRSSLERRLAQGDTTPPAQPVVAGPVGSVLDTLDLTATVEEAEYGPRLKELHGRIARLTEEAREAERTTVLVFEGWDAAGKGGTIRRITTAMDARNYRVVPIGAPDPIERVHHYLWRFWRELPRAGRMLIFDRSWYGRVLVERVEGYAREDEWRRAYAELRDFEDLMVEHGMLVRKFWLHISPEEQLRRFQAREKTPYKKYKITEDDYRNRDKWDEYVAAIDEMVLRTSTARAPWILVPANDKRLARLRVLEEVCAGLEQLLDEARREGGKRGKRDKNGGDSKKRRKKDRG